MTEDATNNPKSLLRSPSNIRSKDQRNTYAKHEAEQKKDFNKL